MAGPSETVDPVRQLEVKSQTMDASCSFESLVPSEDRSSLNAMIWLGALESTKMCTPVKLETHSLIN